MATGCQNARTPGAFRTLRSVEWGRGVVPPSLRCSRGTGVGVLLPDCVSNGVPMRNGVLIQYVMAGLVPAIHGLFAPQRQRTWMPGTSPGMTVSVVDWLGKSPEIHPATSFKEGLL